MAGCFHGVVVVSGDGGCCCDGGGYGLCDYSVLPPCPPPPHPPLPPPSPRAGAFGEASGCTPCLTVLQSYWMFGCAGRGCDALSGGGGGCDGGGCAGLSLVHSSEAALPPLFGLPQLSAPGLGLRVAPGLDGSHGNLSSWRQLPSCFCAHPATRKCNGMSHTCI